MGNANTILSQERRLGFHDLPMVEKAVVGDRRALLLTAAPARLYFEFKLGEIEHEIPAASASGKLAVYRKRSQDTFTSAIARLFGILSSWKRDEASQLLSVDIVVLDDTPIESRSKRDRVLDLTLSSDLELLPVVDVIGHIEIKGRGNIRIKPSCKASLLARLPNVGSFELDLGRVPMTLDEALGKIHLCCLRLALSGEKFANRATRPQEPQRPSPTRLLRSGTSRCWARSWGRSCEPTTPSR